MPRTGRYGENIDIDHIQGSDGWPVFGHTFDYLIDTYSFGQRMRARYGEVYRCAAFFQRFIVFASPEGAEFVLKDEANQFSSKLGWEAFLGRLFPHSLPTMDFEEHRHHRRIMQSVFKKNAMLDYVGLIEQVVKDNMTAWETGDTVKAYPTIKALTLNIAGKAFLGLDLEKDMDYISRTFIQLNGGLAAIVPYPVPGLALWKALRARERMFNYFGPLIAEKRKSETSDIFSRLCQAKDEDGEDFTDEAILYHLVNILAAAHDTSTTSLTLTLHFLMKHPEWQDRLRELCLSRKFEHITYDDLEQLEEIEWVFKETMRIYPPAPQLFRRSIKDCEFNGIYVPANTQVMVDCGYIHRAKEYWREPMKFDPERFSPARAEHKAHQYLWFPFGGGAHTCIGLRFAIMTAKITLYHLLTRYKFELDTQQETKYTILPITKPRNGLPIKVTRVT